MCNLELFISSDELRTLTFRSGSEYQVQRLIELGVVFSVDIYGTPMVRRADFDRFKKFIL
jgi:hypothetical protein